MWFIINSVLISLARLVDDMKSRLRTIDTELRAEPELDYKVREMEMDLKSLDHKLNWKTGAITPFKGMQHSEMQ